MDTTYRLRFLIYLAAFMLAMSICFVYAEPLPSQNHLLFQLSPQHAGFLAPSTEEPTFDPAALHAATPFVSPHVLQRLEETPHGRHGFFHRTKHAIARPLPADGQSASSVIGLSIESPYGGASTAEPASAISMENQANLDNGGPCTT